MRAAVTRRDVLVAVDSFDSRLVSASERSRGHGAVRRLLKPSKQTSDTQDAAEEDPVTHATVKKLFLRELFFFYQ